MWEPSTRGTSPSEHMCHWGLCGNTNTELAYYTMDDTGVRYFCEEHWAKVNLFFASVATCVFCDRNYHAEFYKESRTISSVKHAQKWWELCLKHRMDYDDTVCSFMDGLSL